MVPEGWFEGRVSDLVSALEAGVSVNGENRPRKPYEKAVLKVSAVSYGYFDKNACKVISNEELKRARINPKAGQIIISRSNTGELVGASAFIEKNYDYLFLPDKLWQIVPKSHSDMRWLSYILSSEKLRHALSHLATGTSGSMKNITKSELLSLKIFIPPLPEQKKIARILSTWDKAIETVERLIENSKTQKKALMQQLLTGKRRLPGFEGVWEEVCLADICSINPKRLPCVSDTKVSFIPMDAVSEDAKLIRYNIQEYSKVKQGFTSFTDGDVLIAKITPCFENGKGAYVENLMNGIGFGSTEFHVLRAKMEINSKFIYYLTNTREFRVRGETNMQGSAGQKRVTTNYLRGFKVAISSDYKEQQKIATVLTTVDRKIENLQQKLDYLKQEKKALMQQLLTGKRRVKVDADG